jgi:hypothetical protein
MKKDAGEKKLKRKMVGTKKMVVEEKGKDRKKNSLGGLPDESMKRKGVAVLSQQAKKKQQLALSGLASGVTTPLPPPVPSEEAAAAPSVSGQPKDVVLAADFMPLDRPVQNEEALSKHRTKKNKEKNNKVASLNATVGTVTSGFLPSRSTSGVLYIGHIPHGFYEDQMRGSRFPLPTNLSCMGECLCLLACNCFLLLLRPKVFVQPHCFVLLWQGFLANLELLSASDYLEIRRQGSRSTMLSLSLRPLR